MNPVTTRNANEEVLWINQPVNKAGALEQSKKISLLSKILINLEQADLKTALCVCRSWNFYKYTTKPIFCDKWALFYDSRSVSDSEELPISKSPWNEDYMFSFDS